MEKIFLLSFSNLSLLQSEVTNIFADEAAFLFAHSDSGVQAYVTSVQE